jgi:hypothetical protein
MRSVKIPRTSARKATIRPSFVNIIVRSPIGHASTIEPHFAVLSNARRSQFVTFFVAVGFRGCTKNVRKATSASVTLYYEQTLSLSLVDLHRISCIVFAELCGRGS